MVEVPVELRSKYHHRRDPYQTDALIDSFDDDRLLQHMGVPAHYRDEALLIQDWHPSIETWIEQLPYIYRPQPENRKQKPKINGFGLALYGPTGTGKTTTSAALLLRLVRMLIPNADPDCRSRWYGAAMGAFVSWQEFSRLAREKSGGDDEAYVLYEELYNRMMGVGPVETSGNWLVIDDISRERATEFNVSELTWILRHRYEHGFPTIITTNTHPDQWPLMYGEVMGNFMLRALLPVEFVLADLR